MGLSYPVRGKGNSYSYVGTVMIQTSKLIIEGIVNFFLM